MKLDVATISYDGSWVEHGEAKLRVRPYPRSLMNVTMKDGGMVFSGESALEMFLYCLVDWEGIVGADDQKLKPTKEVKKKIYDFQLGKVEGVSIADKVMNEARRMMEEIEADKKN